MACPTVQNLLVQFSDKRLTIGKTYNILVQSWPNEISLDSVLGLPHFQSAVLQRKNDESPPSLFLLTACEPEYANEYLLLHFFVDASGAKFFHAFHTKSHMFFLCQFLLLS